MRQLIGVLLLCLPMFFLWLGGPAITDSDEAFYAESGREMVESGDWITPHYNYEPRFEKPILYYWLVAIGYVVAGVGETPARFWSALSGVGLCLIAYACGRRWYGKGQGLLAAAIVATNFGTFAIARQSLPDLPLTFFITLGIWAAIEFLRANQDPAGGREAAGLSRRSWLLLSSAAIALGMLTKGPVAVALPVAVLVPLIVVEQREQRKQREPRASTRGLMPRVPLSRSDLAIALGVFLLIAAPWYLAVSAAHGPAYLYRFFVGENIERFATTKFNDPRPVWFYLPVVLGGLLPWSPFFLLWVKPLADMLRGRGRLSATQVRLGLWALGPLVVFTVSVGKQPRYVLPCLLPLAILLAQSIWRRTAVAARVKRDVLMMAAGTTTGVIIVLVGLLIRRAGPLLAAVDPGWSARGPTLIMAAGGMTIAASLVTRRHLPLILTMAAAVTLLAVQRSVLILGRPEPVEVIGRAVEAEGPAANVCTCGAFARNLVFYSGKRTVMGDSEDRVREILTTPERTLAAIDADMLARVEVTPNRRFRRIAEAAYLNTARLRLGTFLKPDAARDLQRVILVSNH